MKQVEGLLRAWVVAVLGVLASGAVWWLLAQQEARAVEAQFQFDAGERELVIQERFEDATRALRAVGAFYDTTAAVNGEQFSRFVGPMVELHPYIHALGWNPLITDARRDAFEARMRAAGLGDYQITEREPSGQLVRASRRDFYVAVQFIEPLVDNEPAIGFDTASELNRRRAIMRAWKTGELALTSRIILVQEREQQYAALCFLPVFARGGTESAGERLLAGMVVGVLRIGAVVESAFEAFDPVAIGVTITDESADEGEQLLYASPLDPRSSGVPERLRHSRSFELGGRQWRIDLAPSSAYLTGLESRAPVAGLIVGLLFTALTTAYLARLTGETTRVDRLVGERTAQLEREINRREATEQELSASQHALEDRVRERTSELESAMATLRTAEAALLESEERLRLTLDSVADGAWDWNVATGEVFFSDSWLESMGYGRAEVEPHVDYWKSLLHPEDVDKTLREVRRHLVGETEVYDIQNRMLTKTKDYRWHLTRGRVVARDSDGKALRMVGTDTDISRRRQEEQQLRKTQNLESLGVLPGGIAHDFNNLLVAMLGGTDLALDELPADSPAREHLNLAKTAAERAADLIRQIHAYSGSASFTTERIDLAALIEGVGRLLRASVSKKARVRFQFVDGLPEVEGDATQLRQVAMNLIVNASDALGDLEGDITVSTSTVALDAEHADRDYPGQGLEPGDYVALTVSDTGGGMSSEVMGMIFDPFFTTKKMGQGLGLAATLGVVRSHHGGIQVSSEVGVGTTIRVLLPGALPLEVPPELRAGSEAEASWKAVGTALVVDDDAAVRGVAERMLGALGMKVVTAADGVEGVEVFSQQRDEISVVVLDMSMPRMDGADAFREIRRIDPRARVLLSSGYSERDAAALLTNDRLADFVQKPYRVAELKSKLRSILSVS